MHLNCGHHNFNLSITIYFTMKKHVGILFFFMLTIVFSGIAQTIHHWETAVFNNDMWKYFSGKSEPNDLWRQLNFDDSLWKSGQGGFGYGDDDDNTNIEQDAAPAYQYPPSVYLRIKINIPDTSKISFGYLQMDVDDAFVAYINDIEIARLGIGVKGDNPAFNQLGANHEATMYAGGSPESFLISKATLRTCLKPGQNVLAIQVHNSSYTSSDMSSNAYLSFAIRDASVIFRPTPSWFVEPDLSGITPDFTSSNLPVVVINTNGASIIDEPKIPADMKIIFHDDKSPNYLSDPGNVYDGKIGIEIRGASSAGFPQKPYGLETRDMTGANLNVSLLGMPADNDWVLLSNYNDKVYMRNTLAFELFRKMGHYAPRMRHCEVVMNDQYQGIYLYGEKIKQGKPSRVNIAKLTMLDDAGDDVTGGYIFKTDYDDGYGTYWTSSYSPVNRPGGKVRFVYHVPKATDLIDAQKEYIKNHVNTVESALYGANFKDRVNGYRKYLDVSSFVDYFIIGELSRNVDAYKKSRFFYKDKDSKDMKIYSGPVWDYDWAWKNMNDCYFLSNTNGTGWAYKINECNVSPTPPSWEVRMLQDPYFANAINDRYFTLRKTILSQSFINNYIDSVANLLAEAQIRHEKKWKTLGKNVGAPEIDYQPTTFAGDITKFKNWITTRLAWLDANMVGQSTAISDMSAEVSLRVYPNPVQHELTIEAGDKMKRIVLLNSIGQHVVDIQPITEIISVETAPLPRGMYIVNITLANGKQLTSKIIKE